MKTTDTHHEEARIAAIAAASPLEEEWTDATTEKDKLTTELSALQSECDTVMEYLGHYEESATVKMLKLQSYANKFVLHSPQSIFFLLFRILIF